MLPLCRGLQQPEVGASPVIEGDELPVEDPAVRQQVHQLRGRREQIGVVVAVAAGQHHRPAPTPAMIR